MKKIFILILMMASMLSYASKDLATLNTLKFNTVEKQLINGREKKLEYKIGIDFPDKVKKEMTFPEMNKGEIYIYNSGKKQIYLPIFDEIREMKSDSDENNIIKTLNKIRDLSNSSKVKKEYQNKKLKSLYIDDNQRISIVIKEYTEVEGYVLPKIIEVKDGDISLGTISISDIEINPIFSENEFKIKRKQMIFLKGNGLVIGKKEVEEADRYITIFMEDFGKVSTLIKGIRKSKKRDKVAVDLISLTNFTFYQKGDSTIVSDFSGIENYEKIKVDYDKLNIALYLLYFINNILIEKNRNRKLYNLLLKSLNSLNKDNELRQNLLLVVYFLYEVLKEEGLIPEVEDISIFFMEQNQKKISLEEQKILKKLYTNDIKEIIDNKNYRIEDIKKVIVTLEIFINSNLSLNLDARKFLWGELLW